MRIRPRLVAAGVLVIAAVSAPAWGPPLLRPIDWFQVRRVEVSGTRLLAPHQVLAASGIRKGVNLWDDTAPAVTALRSHPAIARARVTRRLPHTLRIRVEEERPVAFVNADALVPVTAAGAVFPVDPARERIDLPILAIDWRQTAVAERGRLVAETGRLSGLDPALFARVSHIRPALRDSMLLILEHPVGEIWMPVGAGTDRLSQLRAVLDDLDREQTVESGSTAAGGYRIDLRFAEQVVVRSPEAG